MGHGKFPQTNRTGRRRSQVLSIKHNTHKYRGLCKSAYIGTNVVHKTADVNLPVARYIVFFRYAALFMCLHDAYLQTRNIRVHSILPSHLSASAIVLFVIPEYMSI